MNKHDKPAPDAKVNPDEIAAFDAALDRATAGLARGRVLDESETPEVLREFFAEFDKKGAQGRADGERGKTALVERYGQKKIEDYLTFMLEDELYGLQIAKVREIIKPGVLTLLPRMPPWVAGLLSLRGSIVPVFSLALKLGLGAQTRTRTTRVVVFEDRDELIGFYVDEVKEVVRLPLHGIEPPPQWKGQQHQEIIRGVGRADAKMIILLEFDALVGHLRAA